MYVHVHVHVRFLRSALVIMQYVQVLATPSETSTMYHNEVFLIINFNLFTDRDKRSTTPSPSPGIEEITQGSYATCSYQSSAVALAICVTNLVLYFS